MAISKSIPVRLTQRKGKVSVDNDTDGFQMLRKRTPVNLGNTSRNVPPRMRHNYKRHEMCVQSDYDRYAHDLYHFRDVNPSESLLSDVD